MLTLYAAAVLLLVALKSFGASLKLHWIVVINADNFLYGYPAAAPMYEVAFQTVKGAYPDLFSDTIRTMVYQPGMFTCAESASVMLTASAKVSQAIESHPGYWPIIFAPGCNLEIQPLGDFAREWDVPILSAIAGDPSLRDKNRFPTLLAFPGADQESLTAAFAAFMEHYKWNTFTVLVDSVSQHGAAATFYGSSWNGLSRKIQDNIGRYTVYRSFFDSKTFETKDFVERLEATKRQSRVVVILTHPKVLRVFMITAHRLNMTNGEYVFLSVQPAKVPTIEDVTWSYSDAEDEVAFEAYKSLIVYKNPDADWEKISDVLDQYAHVSTQMLNKSMSADRKRNDLSITAYESVMVFAQVLNESMDQSKQKNSRKGSRFAQMFWNRSFSSPSRDLYLNPTGIRVDDVVFSRVNFTSGQMQAAWRYYTLSRKLEPVSDLSGQWKSSNGPPAHEPPCGFLDNLCGSTSSNLTLSIAVASGVAVVLFATLVGLTCWWNAQRKQADSMWWLLDSNELSDVDESEPKITILLEAERRICPWNSIKIKTFGDKLVWLKPLGSSSRSLTVLSSDRVTRHCLSVLKNMSHSNVGCFYGIAQLEFSTVVVSEFAHRGSLRNLLQNESVTVDGSLQGSLIWEIISGLRYIHGSPLRCHGELTSHEIMIDKRFSVQICAPAVPKFRNALYLEREESSPTSIWLPPESFQEKSFAGSKEGDIFSLGVLICEVLTKQIPLAVNLADQKAVEVSIDVLKSKPSAPRMTSSKMSSKVYDAVSPCFDPVPQKRPTMQKLSASLERLIPRVQLVDSLVRRLETYAQDLEETVGRRTRELIDEQRKVDELLMEIIPRSLVPALRNKITVPAELFDLVTILFSDIPLFGSVCAVSSPLQTIALLNAIYSLCDRILSRFDVYKVETINDSYVVASGLPVRNGSRHAGEIAQMALGMLEATRDLVSPIDSQRLMLRIGVNTGPCAAGMVGMKMPRYCVFGDTMNTASRMESHGQAGAIHMSTAVKAMLDQLGGFTAVSRGFIPIKGKGDMETFWLKTSEPRNDTCTS